MSTSILHSNSMAISALHQGNYAAANGLLKNALKELRCFQRQDQADQNPSELMDDEMGSSSPAADQSYLETLIIESVPLPVVSYPDTMASHVFMFFNRALLMVRLDGNNKALSTNFLSPDDNESIAKIAQVLLYNLGLTFHLWSFQSGRSAYLTTALQFYQHGMEVVALPGSPSSYYLGEADEGDKPAVLALDINDVLPALALINNVGYIFDAMIDHVRASNCLSMLKEWFDAADEEQANLVDDLVLSENEATFFCLTTFVYPKWSLGTSPAA